ncbi:hypothetical protein HDU76_009666 [Blyttiomyces sp. JEL0837]|nr:hypothetical protein HDU76_009666 [Blyttiomyces sp. JEL0837]
MTTYMQRQHQLAELASIYLDLAPTDYAFDEIFRSNFGVSLVTCHTVWESIDKDDEPYLEMKHLLLALYFLKVYPSENVAISFLKIKSPKTYRKWVWDVTMRINNLDLIDFEYRHINWDGMDPSGYVDGIDCLVQETRTNGVPDKGDYSHKNKHACLRYVIVSCSGASLTCYQGGGVPAGSNNDLSLARETIVRMLHPGKRLAADKGYRGDPNFITPFPTATAMSDPKFKRHNEELHAMAARHETLNGRIKIFNVLTAVFRGDRWKHNIIFGACCQLTQISLPSQPLNDLKPKLEAIRRKYEGQ